MIQFFATQAHHHHVREFLDYWSPDSHGHIRAVPYEKFPVWKPFPAGVCVFTDFERLRPDELSLAGHLADALRARPTHYTVFNDPRRYAGRFNFLKILKSQGVNQYQVWRVNELNGDLKFPVFLRDELNHDGPMTPLLHSRDELDRALAQPSFKKSSLKKHLMVVEYCDCAEGALFRKYSVMNVAGTLVPRHVLFSDKWVTKKPDIVNEQTVEEEKEFIRNFPHAAEINQIFRLAGLDYGRIDYGLCRGRIQVWEINTNPTIVPRRPTVDPSRLHLQSESARRIVEAMLALSERHKPEDVRPFKTRTFLSIKAVQIARRVRSCDRR